MPPWCWPPSTRAIWNPSPFPQEERFSQPWHDLAARRRWPATEMVIAGDDDRRTPGNPGATRAKAAAIASDALLALPQWPADAPESLTDFNDLARWLAGGGA